MFIKWMRNKREVWQGALLAVLVSGLCLNGCVRYNPEVTVFYSANPPIMKDRNLGVFDFDDNRDLMEEGRSFAEYVKKALVDKKFAKKIELAQQGFNSMSEAVTFGKVEGYDYILTGSIDKYVWGGYLADSFAQISIRIIDIRNKVNICWYLTGTLEVPYKKEGRSWLFKKKAMENAPAPKDLCYKILDKMIERIDKPQDADAFKASAGTD